MAFSKVEITTDGKEREISGDEMMLGDCGIVTQVPRTHATRIGELAVRGFNEIIFPRSRIWADPSSFSGYRIRKLRPGEKVIITGDE